MGISTILSYEDRGKWGKSNWRGNCSGHIIKDLLEFYKPKKFVEVFAGSGTGYEVARDMGLSNSLHLDLHPDFGGWNALVDDVPAGSDFVFSHPPYHDMVIYSGKGQVWGDEAHPDDLSRCGSYDEFIHKMNIVNSKIFNSLVKGGRHAMLIGDMRRKGTYYSMIKDLAWYGDLDVHIVKAQHNTVSGRKNYANQNFIPIAHEHLLVFKKSDAIMVNLKITKTEKRSLLNAKLITWRDLVQASLQSLGGKASLSDLYAKLEASEKAKSNSNWQAKIRQTLQLHDEFNPIERGVWGFQFSQTAKTA